MDYFIFKYIFKLKMELFEFNNFTHIVNRFKTVLKKININQIDFPKGILKISVSFFYNALTNKSLVDVIFLKKIFDYTKDNY